MRQVDAARIFKLLIAAFPAVALDEAQSELLIREMALLHDASILDEAVTHLIHREEKFPVIARIRLAYRAVNDARAAHRAALEAGKPGGDTEIPEWVHVCGWHRRATLAERQAANKTTEMPAKERPPVRLRLFPQEAEKGPGGYSWEEYEELREGWVKAGSPQFGVDDFVPSQAIELTDSLPGDCADCAKPSAVLRSYGAAKRPLCPTCVGARLRVAAKIGTTQA